MFKKIPFSLLMHTSLRKVLNRLSEGVIPVFMLHRIDVDGIDGSSVEQIDKFLHLLKKYNYEFLSAEELVHLIEKPGEAEIKNRVMFTMDDGYLDQVSKGVPIFQKHKCPVTIAIITDFISGLTWPWDAKIRYMFDTTTVDTVDFSTWNGQKIEFDIGTPIIKLESMRFIREELKKMPQQCLLDAVAELSNKLQVYLPVEPPLHYQPFGWGDVKRLEGNGVNFIAHTKNHCILTNLTDDEARDEIEGSIGALKEHITPVPLFVYPNGRSDDYNDAHLEILRDCGIKVAFNTENSYLSLYELNKSTNDPYHIPRLSFPEKNEIQCKIINRIDYIADRIRDKTFNKMFEMAYGIKRTTLFKFIQTLFNRSYYNKSRNINIKNVNRLVFICIGNICRSPFAEIIALSEKPNLSIISMGLEASGKDKPDPMARKIGLEFGYNLESLCSSKIDRNKLTSNDLLIVMDISQLKRLKSIVDDVGCQATLLGVWGKNKSLSIDDPFGRSEARFRLIFTHVKYHVVGLLRYIETSRKSLPEN